jgi:hypothetical protein
MSGVLNPLSPDQAKAQVIDAARDVASTLDDLPILKASVRLESCNDDSSPAYPEGPYRGSLLLQYPPTSSRSAGRSAIDGYIQRLLNAGWSPAPESWRSSAPWGALARAGVILEFTPSSSGKPNSQMDFLGECRDVTTTRETRGDSEPLDLR